MLLSSMGQVDKNQVDKNQADKNQVDKVIDRPPRALALMLSGQLPPFVAGGFECATHRRADGVRLDLLQSTGHAQWARSDYSQLAALGVRVARDGVRWHLVEAEPGRYDWTGALAIARAAARAGVEVIWDLCHYGWPDHVDVWSPDFAQKFAAFAFAFATVLRREFGAGQAYCPVNEISFLAWTGGDMGRMNPHAKGRGPELKRALAKAAIAATRAIRLADHKAICVCAEPLIHVAPLKSPGAQGYRLAQYEALDMLLGRLCPELGGGEDIVDFVGLNFYPGNQWYFRGSTIPMGHHAYRPLGDMLAEAHRRYGRPIFLAETGAEGRARPYWLHHVAEELRHALGQGVPVRGVCLYPVLDYQGWENGRACDVGLLGNADSGGDRPVYAPLLDELRRTQATLAVAWNQCAGRADEERSP